MSSMQVITTLLLLAMLASCGGTAANTPPTIVVTRADVPQTDGSSPPNVSPSLLAPHRTAGDSLIVPDDDVKLAVAKSGRPLVGAFKYCLDLRGRVDRVTMLRSTQVASYDARIVAR